MAKKPRRKPRPPLAADRLKTVSRYLEKHLARRPERLGLAVAAGGWVAVDELIAACRARHFKLTAEELAYVVGNTRKKRFELSGDGKLVRARKARRALK